MIKIGAAGLLGYETALKLFREHEEEIRNRFSKRFVKDFIGLSRDVPEMNENCIRCHDSFICRIFEISQGGLLGTLWAACDELEAALGRKIGCRIYPDSFPVRQEVVEICELFDEDPFEVPSEGAFITIWDEEAFERYEEKLSSDTCLRMIRQSVIIGVLTNDNKRLLLSDGRERYLTPAGRQLKDIANRSK